MAVASRDAIGGGSGRALLALAAPAQAPTLPLCFACCRLSATMPECRPGRHLAGRRVRCPG